MTRYSSKSWRAFQPDAPRGAPVVDRAPVAAPQVAGGRGPCRILGLDPGSLRTGFGIIDVRGPDMGCVVHGRIDVKGASLAQRMARIHAGVSELLERYAPDEIAVERVFVNKNIDSALKLGQARGAALAALGVDSAVFEYAPRAIKLAAVGFGAADKLQVAHMMRQLLRIDGILTPDASDALAVAVCHAQTRRLSALVAAPDVAPLASAGRR